MPCLPSAKPGLALLLSALAFHPETPHASHGFGGAARAELWAGPVASALRAPAWAAGGLACRLRLRVAKINQY